MSYDLRIIMSKKFLKACKDNNTIKNAIKTIENGLNELVLFFDGSESDIINGGQTHFYDLQSREEKEQILRANKRKETLKDTDEDIREDIHNKLVKWGMHNKRVAELYNLLKDNN